MSIRFEFLRVSYICVLICLSTFVLAQSNNPFELAHRLDHFVSERQTNNDSISGPAEVGSLSEDTAVAEGLEEAAQDSPIALREELKEVPLENEEALITDEIEADRSPGAKPAIGTDGLELPELLQSRRNLIFSTFIILTLFLTVVISFNRAVVNKVIRSILNDNYLNLLYREQRGRWSMQFLFLYIFFIANLALFLFLLDDKWQMDKINANLLYLCGIIGAIYFVRHFSLTVLGNTFPISKETGQFNFTIMLFNIFLGLILLPINLFIAFAPNAIALTFIYIGLGVLILFYLLRQLRGLFIGARFIMNSKFHFLLYLCTIEIAPMAVLFKFFQPYFI